MSSSSTSSQSSSVINQCPAKKVIVAHYHLFKNAGTSVDVILKQNFGSAWSKIEFPKSDQDSNSQLVKEWLVKEQDNISAFSSHTAIFPLPRLDNIVLFPIVFLRHPIIRLWSVYKFERKHQKVLNQSIKLAQEQDFAGYLNYQLDQPHNRSCRNFQTYRFSWLNSQPNMSELAKAVSGLDLLPIVGLVAEFDLSMKLYHQAIAKYYPSFQLKLVHKNITSRINLSLAEQLGMIRSNLDQNTYQRVLDANQDDLRLYLAAQKKLLFQSVSRRKPVNL
jgi:Sulfotransferase family